MTQTDTYSEVYGAGGALLWRYTGSKLVARTTAFVVRVSSVWSFWPFDRVTHPSIARTRLERHSLTATEKTLTAKAAVRAT